MRALIFMYFKDHSNFSAIFLNNIGFLTICQNFLSIKLPVARIRVFQIFKNLIESNLRLYEVLSDVKLFMIFW